MGACENRQENPTEQAFLLGTSIQLQRRGGSPFSKQSTEKALA
jgi:hypothetical protein